MKAVMKSGQKSPLRPVWSDVWSDVRGDTEEPVSFTATEAKNEFGRVLETAMHDGAVIITKHDAPKAVLMSVERFHALAGAPGIRLDALRGEFDALLARMQTPVSRRGMKTAFDASPKQLGNAGVAAVAAASRRRG